MSALGVPSRAPGMARSAEGPQQMLQRPRSVCSVSDAVRAAVGFIVVTRETAHTCASARSFVRLHVSAATTRRSGSFELEGGAARFVQFVAASAQPSPRWRDCRWKPEP
jgi:hypothetical protein